MVRVCLSSFYVQLAVYGELLDRLHLLKALPYRLCRSRIDRSKIVQIGQELSEARIVIRVALGLITIVIECWVRGTGGWCLGRCLDRRHRRVRAGCGPLACWRE